jgi:hypothetical protein
VGVYEAHDSDDVVALRVDVANASPVTAEVSFALDDDIEEFLELLYLDTEQHARGVPPGPKQSPKLAWIGGSASEGDTPEDWVEQVEAVMAVRGFAPTVFQQPYRNFKSVRIAVRRLNPRVIVIWEAYAGDPSGWGDLDPEGAVEIRLGEWGFQESLADVKNQLNAAVDEMRSPASRDVEQVESGAIRIYKKTYSTPGFDKLVETDDCGHNNWAPARKAPKAEKGVDRLVEHGGIKSFEKCMVCTGGGRWRVTFD